MQKSWTLDLSGHTHRLDVDWDLVVSSRGEAHLDGALAHAWTSGVKLPGVVETFQVSGHSITLRQGMVGFDLDLRASPGVRVLDGPAPYSGGGRNLSRRDGILVGVAITVAILGLFLGAAALVSTLAHSRG